MPLELLVCILNSNLADWYFRLGSTNAHVSHYQIANLPCPVFRDSLGADEKVLALARKALSDNDVMTCWSVLRPLCKEPPFSPAVRQILIEAASRICDIEGRRGKIARTERSRLDQKAQLFQGLINRIMYVLAGIDDDESEALEQRLATML